MQAQTRHGLSDVVPQAVAVTARAQPIAAGNCSRCKDGSGLVKHTAGRLHYGVPNLCFACDGEGTREAELRKRQAAAEAKRIADLTREAQAACDAVADQHGGRNQMPPRARRSIVPSYETFTTADYATRTGLSLKEAFIELCRWTCIGVVVDPSTGKPTGWMRG